jgi:hypothetical protein
MGKRRRYTPGGPRGYPVCGQGTGWQISLPDPPKPPKKATLFDAPFRGSRFDELVALAERLNATFNRDAWRSLQKRRESTGEKRLEITLAFDRGRLYLTYALPVRKGR